MGKKSSLDGVRPQNVREPKQERARRSKQAILDAALKAFNERGFSAATSRDIAEAAGVGIGTFYAYYPDKSILFRECVEIYNGKLRVMLAELLNDLDVGATGLRTVLRRSIEALLKTHDIYRGLHNELAIMNLADPYFKEVSIERRRISIQFIQSYMESWKESLGIRDIEGMAIILFDLFHAVADTIAFSYSEIDRDRLIECLLDLVESGITPHP